MRCVALVVSVVVWAFCMLAVGLGRWQLVADGGDRGMDAPVVNTWSSQPGVPSQPLAKYPRQADGSAGSGITACPNTQTQQAHDATQCHMCACTCVCFAGDVCFLRCNAPGGWGCRSREQDVKDVAYCPLCQSSRWKRTGYKHSGYHSAHQTVLHGKRGSRRRTISL